MKLFSSNKLFIFYVLLSILIVAMVYYFSYRRNLDQLSVGGAVRIQQLSDRLLGQLVSYRHLPNLLSRHPEMITVFNENYDQERANNFLLDLSLITGAEEIAVLDRDGITKASSNIAIVGKPFEANIATVTSFKSALDGSLGFSHSIDSKTGLRNFFFKKGIIEGVAPPIGVIVVKVDVARLEFEWSVEREAIAFFDSNQVAFAGNRQFLHLRSLDLVNQNSDSSGANYSSNSLRPFYPSKIVDAFGHRLTYFEENDDLPDVSLAVSKFLPQINFTARGYFDVTEARNNARLQALLATAILSLIGLIFVGLWLRRRLLLDRLAIEEAANLKLEARVEERTHELRSTQNQLVQASKLTALGQLSAGISHEVNQPLAAIQNFAENGAKFIERNCEKDALNNFDLIKEQTNRIARIIKNLRAFARKEVETVEAIDLQLVIADSFGLASMKLNEQNVQIEKTGETKQIFVMAGKVRLQQVFVNLINNSLDAMVDQRQPCIKLDISKEGKKAIVTFSDNGHGFEDENRIFEPFYSTKDIGSSKGLGLGLSISHGIIGSFGGDITCRNLDVVGAQFEITMQLADQKSIKKNNKKSDRGK